MSKEVAVARCRCGNYCPVQHPGYFYEKQIFCTRCGRISSVVDDRVKWVKEDRWAVTCSILGAQPRSYLTREAA